MLDTVKQSTTPAIPFDADRLDRLMDEAGIDVLVTTSKHNVQYLLGGHRAFFFESMDAMGLSRYLPVLVYPKGAAAEGGLFRSSHGGFSEGERPVLGVGIGDQFVRLRRRHAEGDRLYPQVGCENAPDRRRAGVPAGRFRQRAAQRLLRQRDRRRAVRARAAARREVPRGIAQAAHRLGARDRTRCWR